MKLKKYVLGGLVVAGGLLATAATALAAAPDGAAGPWADSVVSSSQGLRKDGSAVLPVRSNPSQTLGAAETTGTPNDNDSGIYEGKFFSLGFGGSVTLKFDNGIGNGEGNDLRVYEATYPNYIDEKIKVEISKDGATWVNVGQVARDGEVELGEDFKCVNYVRLTDVSDKPLFEPTADGYDVDAVKALHSSSDGCPEKQDHGNCGNGLGQGGAAGAGQGNGSGNTCNDHDPEPTDACHTFEFNDAQYFKQFKNKRPNTLVNLPGNFPENVNASSNAVDIALNNATKVGATNYQKLVGWYLSLQMSMYNNGGFASGPVLGILASQLDCWETMPEADTALTSGTTLSETTVFKDFVSEIKGVIVNNTAADYTKLITLLQTLSADPY